MNSQYLQGIEDELEKERIEIDVKKYKQLLENYEPAETVKEVNEQISQVMGVPDVQNMYPLHDNSKEFLKWAYPKVKQERSQLRNMMGMSAYTVDDIPKIVKAVINTHHYEKKDRKLLNTVRKRYINEFKLSQFEDGKLLFADTRFKDCGWLFKYNKPDNGVNRYDDTLYVPVYKHALVKNGNVCDIDGSDSLKIGQDDALRATTTLEHTDWLKQLLNKK